MGRKSFLELIAKISPVIKPLINIIPKDKQKMRRFLKYLISTFIKWFLRQ